MKKRILFLIHDLGPGGAEKVLVNLVNGLDRQKFDISLRTLFNWGPNRDLLLPDVQYSYWISKNIPANSHLMKLWTPEQLYKMIIPEKFDIVISFLEGPCARVVGGCPKDGTKVITWVHITFKNSEKFREGFRNTTEAEKCYSRADALVFVSQDVKNYFCRYFTPKKKTSILHNVYDSNEIRKLSLEEPSNPVIDQNNLNWCSIGKLIPRKGWDRMLKIQKRLLLDGLSTKFYIIGDGPLRKKLQNMASELDITENVIFTGYQMNPYAYLSRCIVAVCASKAEGFSTAAVESLLVGTPFCSIEVGGMSELLGENDEYGIITEDDDEKLYEAVKRFFVDPDHRSYYRQKAIERGRDFDSNVSIKNVENLLLTI